jgi:RNA polymerase sigma-70 factor (ECF subfamily)
VHCYHLGLSNEEAAEVLGIPVGTVKSLVARGKNRLRQLLAAWHEERNTDSPQEPAPVPCGDEHDG